MPRAKIGDVNLYYEFNGLGQAQTLVLVMGLGMDISGWLYQIPEFKKHYQVLAFDNRGVGRSDRPEGPYTTRMMADDAVGLMDCLKIEKAHILGASMGGMIAQEIAINYPHRVDKLVLACTYAQPDKFVKQTLLSGTKTITGKGTADLSGINANGINIEQIVNFMLPLILSRKFIDENKEALDRFLKEFLKYKPSVEGFLAQVTATQNHDAVNRLNQIKAPTLVITGTKDILVPPRSSDVLANGIPGARVAKIDGGTHGFNMEMAEAFNREVLNFLK